MTGDEERAYRARYRRSTGLTVADRRIPAALNRAHILRQFEIENYWKRSTYFWGFQAVAFAAMALLFKDGRIGQPALIAPIAILGIVTGLTGRLTAQGSKFWQENWELHVDLLEESQEGRITKTVLTRNGTSFSVSRLNERLLDILIAGWCGIFVIGIIATAWPALLALPPGVAKAVQIGVPVLFLAWAVWRLLRHSKSELPGREYQPPDFDQEHARQTQRPSNPTIIRR